MAVAGDGDGDNVSAPLPLCWCVCVSLSSLVCLFSLMLFSKAVLGVANVVAFDGVRRRWHVGTTACGGDSNVSASLYACNSVLLRLSFLYSVPSVFCLLSSIVFSNTGMCGGGGGVQRPCSSRVAIVVCSGCAAAAAVVAASKTTTNQRFVSLSRHVSP